jgi:uridine monophosphate synthetase
MGFFDELRETAKRRDSLLCVGLDPDFGPDAAAEGIYERIMAANRRVIEGAAPYVLCFKPNIAFYEAWGTEGLRALKDSLALIPEGCPVFLDAKRGDIGNTAKAYAKAAFQELGADAITLSPYMGRDAFDPFLAYADRGVFALARTSNPAASRFQDLSVRGSSPFPLLYHDVGMECASWSANVGLVVAGNDYEALAQMREALPKTWFLAPGIGAQGGEIEKACDSGLDAEGFGLIPVVVRAIQQAEDVAKAAKGYRDAINDARARRLASGSGAGAPRAHSFKDRVLSSLISIECFKLGDFTLKSGKKSPFYIDLRRVISDPRVLATVADAYATLLDGLSFDRIAGIPTAAVPLAAAVSLRVGKPMIYPRMPVKEHGTGNRVEGAFNKGERVVLLDDLITTGLSKIEAADILRGEGLVVEDLIVLIERGSQGRRDMAERGIALRAYAHVSEFFELCQRKDLIDDAKRREMEAFVAAD